MGVSQERVFYSVCQLPKVWIFEEHPASKRKKIAVLNLSFLRIKQKQAHFILQLLKFRVHKLFSEFERPISSFRRFNQVDNITMAKRKTLEQDDFEEESELEESSSAESSSEDVLQAPPESRHF